MIIAGTRFRIARVPLSRIVVTMVERRYPQRVLEYYERLTDPQRASDDVLLHLAPLSDGYYTLLDGHHRFLALVLAGRSDSPALIIIEPGQRGYDEAISPAIVVFSNAA